MWRGSAAAAFCIVRSAEIGICGGLHPLPHTSYCGGASVRLTELVLTGVLLTFTGGSIRSWGVSRLTKCEAFAIKCCHFVFVAYDWYWYEMVCPKIEGVTRTVRQLK